MQDQNNPNRAVANLMKLEYLPSKVALDPQDHRMLRFWGLLLMACLVAASFYLFLNASQLIDRFSTRIAAAENPNSVRIRQYNQALEAIQDRMTVFVADSVETKLKSLDKKLSAGAIGAQEIKTLEELKGELKLLERYSAGKDSKLTDLAQLEHTRFQVTPGTSSAASSGDFLSEVSQVKRLLYLGIASCGLVGFMIGGYWWQSYHRSRRIHAPSARAKLLEGKRGSGSK
jgi:hypothetical protein